MVGGVGGHRRGGRRGRGAALVAALGALTLLVGVLVTAGGAGEAQAATVTGQSGNYGGGCLENANNSTATNNPQQLNYCGTPATTGQRTDLLHVLFSRDPSKGTVDIWDNGAQVLSGYKPAGGTLYPTTAASTATMSSYWKMGIYRDSSVTQQAVYTIESAKVGNTRAQVS